MNAVDAFILASRSETSAPNPRPENVSQLRHPALQRLHRAPPQRGGCPACAVPTRGSRAGRATLLVVPSDLVGASRGGGSRGGGRCRCRCRGRGRGGGGRLLNGSSSRILGECRGPAPTAGPFQRRPTLSDSPWNSMQGGGDGAHLADVVGAISPEGQARGGGGGRAEEHAAGKDRLRIGRRDGRARNRGRSAEREGAGQGRSRGERRRRGSSHKGEGHRCASEHGVCCWLMRELCLGVALLEWFSTFWDYNVRVYWARPKTTKDTLFLLVVNRRGFDQCQVARSGRETLAVPRGAKLCDSLFVHESKCASSCYVTLAGYLLSKDLRIRPQD